MRHPKSSSKSLAIFNDAIFYCLYIPAGLNELIVCYTQERVLFNQITEEPTYLQKDNYP